MFVLCTHIAMLLPKTSSEKTSAYSNVHKCTRYCEANEDSLHSGSTLKSGAEHNKEDGEPHSSDSALIFCTSLFWLFESVCQSNLTYHNLSLPAQRKPAKNILWLLLEKTNKKWSVKEICAQSVCGCSHTALLPLPVSYRPYGTTTKKSHVKSKVLPQGVREWHAKMTDSTSLTHYREQWYCQK